MAQDSKYRYNQLFEIILLTMLAVLLGTCSISIVNEIISPIIRYIFILSMLFMFFSSQKNSINRREFIYMFSIVLFGLGALLMNGSSFAFIIHPIFIMFVVSFLIKVRLSKRFYNYLGTVAVGAWILSIITSLRFTGAYIDLLMSRTIVGKMNPNLVSFTLGATYWIVKEWIQRKDIGKQRKLFLIWGLSISTLVFMVRCRSRASLAAFVIAFAIDKILGKKLGSSKKLAYSMYWGSVLLGTLLPAVYVFIWKNTFFHNINVLGKNIFTGRQTIWYNFFEYLEQIPRSFFVGTGYNTDFYIGGTFDLHNSYMQILAEFGILVFLIYFLFLFITLTKAYKFGRISENKRNFLMMGVFLLMAGYAEIFLISSKTSYCSIIAFGLLGTHETLE